MTIDKKNPDTRTAPVNYDQFYREWGSFFPPMVKRNGIDESNKEDVSSEIMLRMIQRDFLSFYDPARTFVHDGKTHSASWKTFLASNINLYCRGQRDKIKRCNDREMLVMDKPTHYQDIDSKWGEWWGVDAIVSHEDAVIAEIDSSNTLTGLRAHLGTVPRRNTFDKCNLVELYDAVMDQINTIGRMNAKLLEEKFAMSTSGMAGWIKWFEANVCEYLDLPLPVKRPRRKAA